VVSIFYMGMDHVLLLFDFSSISPLKFCNKWY